ncbi:MAG: UDP-2,4-diacetamido-2,4,6-trideoxy-beta-L-altropyranose hydrolase [Candidatus Sulfotelmatobacter sp.]
MTNASLNTATLLLRADANVAIGTGHVMRCLGLAQAWQDAGGRAVFATAEAPVALEQRLESEGFSIERIAEVPGEMADAKATAELARRLHCSWLVVDGDRFGANFLEYLKSPGLHVLLIDDFAQRESFPADLILNPNLGVSEGEYRKRVAPLLLGEKYVLLRREFATPQAGRTLHEKASKILVTMGGSDPENLTPRIVESLAPLGHEITVIVGPGYSHLAEVGQIGSSNVRILLNSSNMAEIMAQSDLAVIAAGGTLWELLSMGCIVLSYARNFVQARVVEELEKKGVVRNLGATKDFDGVRLSAAIETLARSKELREQMSSIGRRLVDACGATRAVQAMRNLEGCG